MKDYITAKERLTFTPTWQRILTDAFYLVALATLIYVFIYEVIYV